MVKVYYEQAGYAQLVAYFDDENTYNKCVEALEQDAQENNFKFITESTNDLDLTEIDEIIEPIFNDEKTFYLIGGDATREYNDNGIEGVVNESEANELTVSTFCFIEGKTRSSELAEALNGWDDYVIITEEEFNLIN